MRADHFSARGVRFLLVGDEAVIFHGYPRLTGDVDLWWEQTRGNTMHLFAALQDFWNGMIPGIATVGDLMEPNVVIQFGRPPHRIDFLSAIDGVTFGEAWERRVDEAIVTDDGRRAPLPIIGLAELIQNKRASGRHKDLDDVEHLSAPRPNP